MPILDYLYIDLPKIASLYGQIANAGAGLQGGALENGKPQHTALMALEAELAAQGHLLDLSRDSPRRSLRNADLRKTLSTTLCVKVTGRAAIENYHRIRRLIDTLPGAAAYVNNSVQSAVRGTDDFKQLEMTITAVAEQLKEDTDRSSRAASQSHLQQMKSDLDEAMQAATMVGEIDQWKLDGLKTWIDTFLPDIINLRVYPSPEFPDEQIFGNLKREHFQDQDMSALHFAHSGLPSGPMTMLGIVTSLPTEGPDAFRPLAEFDNAGLANAEILEKSHREVLHSVDALDRLGRTCRYPRVMVQPLLVYRSFEANRSGPQAP